jgi:broad specificity phosphatase PhoE
MGKIFVVRHGQDEDNANLLLNGRRDRPLTALGRKQAEAAAQKLKKYHIDSIYSSPLKRAFETAQIIAKELGISRIQKDENLIERDFGILTGKPYTEVPKYATKMLSTDHILFLLAGEGVEEFPAVYKRAEKFLKNIQKKHPEENVLIVAHGDVLKMMESIALGWDWEEGLKTAYIPNAGIIELVL